MGMKFSKFMGCYVFLGLWGFYKIFFFFFGIFWVVYVMLCCELVIFLALAFVKVPWMMAGDCGWATIFFFWRNKLSLCYCKIEILEIGRERAEKD